MICSAFRLARFNAQKRRRCIGTWSFFSLDYQPHSQEGTVAQLVILNHFIQIRFGTDIVTTLLPFITFALGLFMVSKVPFFNVTSKIGLKQGILAMILEFSAAILFFVITPELALSTALSIYLIICAMYGVVKGKQLKRAIQQRNFTYSTISGARLSAIRFQFPSDC